MPADDHQRSQQNVAPAENKARDLARVIRRAIVSGEYQPGVGLPSEAQLCDMYKVGRGTVRRAMAQLVAEGLVRSHHGMGHFVREYAPIDFHVDTFEHSRHRQDVDPGADAWEAEVLAAGRRPDQEVSPSIEVPAPLVAEALSVPDGEMVAVRRRLRTVDDEPYMTADSYYPLDVAQGTPILQPGNIRIPGGLMAAAGHKQVRYRDVITSRPPSQAEAERLRIEPGTSVAEYLRTGFNADGRAVRFIITIAPGDRVRLVYEVSAE